MKINEKIQYEYPISLLFLFIVFLTAGSCRQQKNSEILDIAGKEPYYPIIIKSRNPKVISAHFVSAPYTIKINESFNSDQFQNIKFKLLKIDKEKNRCLIKYEGSANNKIINPEWFEKGKAIFPHVFGERRVIVDDLRDEEISIVISVGGVITEEYD